MAERDAGGGFSGQTMIGTRLGSYHVLSLLGQGGMGKVYRARDTRLGREVAIKVLPSEFSTDADRLARFEREACVLAALNHPNIATIYGVEEGDGFRALVMELVEGPTLAERLGRGPIPLSEALPLAGQIAEALAAAHDKGIIHRDLKPANIKLTSSGAVKLLDFGLAKAVQKRGDGAGSELSTVDNLTSEGLIVGTAAYMSPEQARGLPVDRRTDVWAFGCVFYEMLSGRSVFGGTTVSDILAAVLNTEPDWSGLPPETSPAIRRLLRRSLEKDPAWRLPDMTMVRVELRDAPSEPRWDQSAASSAPPPFSRFRFIPYVALLGAALLVAVTVGRTRRPSEPPRTLLRFAIDLPSQADVGITGTNPIAISPDGTRLAYFANRRLSLHALDQLEPIVVAGTEASAVQNPVFSPDSAWVAFWQAGELLRVSVSGGAPVKICDAPMGTAGTSWESNGQILIGAGTRGIMRVPAAGGSMESFISIRPGEYASSPQLLPGGQWVLFVVTVGGNWDQGQVVAQSPTTGERRTLMSGARTVQYLPSGHIVYGRGTGLLAQAFDAGHLTLEGTPVPMIDGILGALNQSPAMFFALSQSGTLAYIPTRTTSSISTRLIEVTRGGAQSELAANPGMTWYPRYSPDGSRVAFGLSASTDLGEAADLLVREIARGAQRRITSTGNNRFVPTWSADGHRLTYADGAGPANHVLWTLADGTGGTETLIGSGRYFPTSWSPDGRLLAVYGSGGPAAGTRDVALLHVDGEKRTLVPFVQTPFEERGGIFSRDGKWVAYVSDQSGPDEVYARPTSGTGGEVIVSAGGGKEPVWARSGKELFYRHEGKLLVVRVDTSAPSLVVSAPSIVFADKFRPDTGGKPGGVANYDISPDGDRFLMVEEPQIANDARQLDKIRVILNWAQDLTRRVPAK
jgi:serine/threonine-protein kinase